jgi:hypothetical protein
MDPKSQAVVDAAAALAEAIRLAGTSPKTDTYDPAHVPVAKDEVVLALRGALAALQVAAMGVAVFAPGTPAAAAVTAIASLLPGLEKLVEDAVVQIELLASGGK